MAKKKKRVSKKKEREQNAYIHAIIIIIFR